VVIYDRVQELTKKVAESEAVAKDWGVKVKSIDSLPDQLIKSAKLPIDGLGYDGANFTYAGRPLDNLSDSEMITFSLNIARSLAGDLKVICIDRLEALDDDTRSELDKQMESDDFQYFVTERTKGDLQVRTLF
jgi:exonuclease SbcC